jgi:hypothetical protein
MNCRTSVRPLSLVFFDTFIEAAFRNVSFAANASNAALLACAALVAAVLDALWELLAQKGDPLLCGVYIGASVTHFSFSLAATRAVRLRFALRPAAALAALGLHVATVTLRLRWGRDATTLFSFVILSCWTLVFATPLISFEIALIFVFAQVAQVALLFVTPSDSPFRLNGLYVAYVSIFLVFFLVRHSRERFLRFAFAQIVAADDDANAVAADVSAACARLRRVAPRAAPDALLAHPLGVARAESRLCVCAMRIVGGVDLELRMRLFALFDGLAATSGFAPLRSDGGGVFFAAPGANKKTVLRSVAFSLDALALAEDALASIFPPPPPNVRVVAGVDVGAAVEGVLAAGTISRDCWGRAVEGTSRTPPPTDPPPKSQTPSPPYKPLTPSASLRPLPRLLGRCFRF